MRAVSARQCKDFYQPLTAPTGLGLLRVAPRRGFSRSGSAWLGRSRKDGLPTRCGDMRITVQGHQLAQQGGAAWSLPLLIGGRKWTPSRATSLCFPSCRCPAQSPPGRGIETFLARCFLPSVQSLCSARPMGSGADIRYAEESPALLVGERGRGKDACGRI